MYQTRKNLLVIALIALLPSLVLADADSAKLKSAVNKGVEFLKLVQAEDGSWTSSTEPGITALVTHALLISGVPADDPAVAKGLAHLKTHVKEDGGIYDTKSTHRNYETCISLMAFQSANKDGRYSKLIDNAVKFAKGLQWDQSEGIMPDDPAFGGSGYGSHQRPDLSNTTFFVEAMKVAGVPSSDPAIQNALQFISRCQNLDTDKNDTEFAGKVDDGGFYYTIAAGGESKAGVNADGGLRSYASMTYAGLKSMIYAGVGPDDRRVKAARDWISQHYTLKENPGMGQQGLFYYYHTFAKTLNALGVKTFEEADGSKHDWREELVNHLSKVQKSNGSWVNETSRWFEGNPHLVTAYALMALEQCK